MENVEQENKDDQIIRWLGQKLQTTIPATIYKSQAFANPELTQPATISQYFDQRLVVWSW